MPKPIMSAQGADGEITLFPDRVLIVRRGLWNALKFGFNTQREIPLSAITEIGFKNANFFMFGEIDFISGGRAAAAPSGASKKKTANPNAVTFKKDAQPTFEVLKEKVFEQMAQKNQKKA